MEEKEFKKICKEIIDNANAKEEFKEFIEPLDLLREINPDDLTEEQNRKMVEVMRDISTKVIDDKDGNFLYEETKIGNRKPTYNYIAS